MGRPTNEQKFKVLFVAAGIRLKKYAHPQDIVHPETAACDKVTETPSPSREVSKPLNIPTSPLCVAWYMKAQKTVRYDRLSHDPRRWLPSKINIKAPNLNCSVAAVGLAYVDILL